VLLRSRIGKWILVLWACALAFGLSHQLAEAEEAHSSCSRACKTGCGPENCSSYIRVGCECYYFCDDGSSGSTICVE